MGFGIVVSIQEEGGLFEKLEVHYKKGGQRHKKFIPRYSKQLKVRGRRTESRNDELQPPSNDDDTEDSFEDSDSPKSKPPSSKTASGLTDGWTEHFDKRTRRYYYNNKAAGKTLWDKEALKQGVIPEIRTRSPQ